MQKEQIIDSISKKISLEKDHILQNVLPKLAPGERLSEYREKEIVSDIYMDLALSFYVPIKLDDPSDTLASLQITKTTSRKIPWLKRYGFTLSSKICRFNYE